MQCLLLAKILHTGEKRALKVIPIPHDASEIEKRRGSGFTDDEIKKGYYQVKDKVLDEILTIIQLRGNENVVHIYGYKEIQMPDQIGWLVCFDMEYLPPLKEIQRLDEFQIVRMGVDICNALKSCHEKRIIHRDIKPENILQRGDSYVLADFGESKIVTKQSSLSLRGTYDYMAPELVRHQKYTNVTPDTIDIYSLGIALYLYANENRLPFVNSIKEMMYADVRDEANTRRWNGEKLPLPSSVSEQLGRIILCACQPDPRKRYQTAADMADDLDGLLSKQYQIRGGNDSRELPDVEQREQTLDSNETSDKRNNTPALSETVAVSRLVEDKSKVLSSSSEADTHSSSRVFAKDGDLDQKMSDPVIMKSFPQNETVKLEQEVLQKALGHTSSVPGSSQDDSGNPVVEQEKGKKKRFVFKLCIGLLCLSIVGLVVGYSVLKLSKKMRNSKSNQTYKTASVQYSSQTSLPEGIVAYNDQKTQWLKNYISTLDVQEKADLYVKILSEASDEMIQDTSKRNEMETQSAEELAANLDQTMNDADDKTCASFFNLLVNDDPDILVRIIDASKNSEDRISIQDSSLFGTIDEALYSIVIDNFHYMLKEEIFPSEDERLRDFYEFHSQNGNTESLLRKKLKDSAILEKSTSDKDFVQRVYSAIIMKDISSEKMEEGMDIVQQFSREYYIDYLLSNERPKYSPNVYVIRDSGSGQYWYYIDNKDLPNEKYIVRTYLYDGDYSVLDCDAEKVVISSIDTDMKHPKQLNTVQSNVITKGPQIKDLPAGAAVRMIVIIESLNSDYKTVYCNNVVYDKDLVVE